MNIVITGAGKGIGFETAKLLSSIKGNFVLAFSRHISALNKLGYRVIEDTSSGLLFPYTIDLNKKGFEKELASEVARFGEKIDILVNNAGVLINKKIEKLTSEDFDLMFAVNTKAPFLLVRSLLPYFNKHAHIINIGSMGGFQGSAKFPGLSLYSASKGALAILTECMAEELKDKNISVNCLALGSVQTEMLSKAFPGYKAPVTSAEMAAFIADFALNGHKVFNGKIIPVAFSSP